VLFAREIAPELMAESEADVISIGPGESVAAAQQAMEGKGVQGNVDNRLLLEGSADDVREAAEACIREGRHRGHVLNLGHGVLRETPVENVQAFINAAHRTRASEVEAQT
jgi:uroporphyrinogen decarboxylase